MRILDFRGPCLCLPPAYRPGLIPGIFFLETFLAPPGRERTRIGLECFFKARILAAAAAFAASSA